MRKTGIITAIIFCCVLFMGSAVVRAPVLPSKNFYINDYADVIDKSYRDAMLKTATQLNEKTGAQVVVLTVQGSGEMDADSFVKAVFDGWNIGGESGNGALIFLLHWTDASESRIYVGDGLSEILTGEKVDPIYYDKMIRNFSQGDFSDGLYEGLASISDIVFEHYGEKSSVVKPKKSSEGSPADYMIIVAAALFIMLRGWRVSTKYRKRYGQGYVYKPRSYTRERRRFEDDDYPSGFGGIIKVTERKNDDEYGSEIEAEPDDNRQN